MIEGLGMSMFNSYKNMTPIVTIKIDNKKYKINCEYFTLNRYNDFI